MTGKNSIRFALFQENLKLLEINCIFSLKILSTCVPEVRDQISRLQKLFFFSPQKPKCNKHLTTFITSCCLDCPNPCTVCWQATPFLEPEHLFFLFIFWYQQKNTLLFLRYKIIIPKLWRPFHCFLFWFTVVHLHHCLHQCVRLARLSTASTAELLVSQVETSCACVYRHTTNSVFAHVGVLMHPTETQLGSYHKTPQKQLAVSGKTNDTS